MSRISQVINASLSLGLLNVLRVVWYKLSLRAEINPVCQLDESTPSPPFFNSDILQIDGLSPRKGWYEYQEEFGFKKEIISDLPPSWLGASLNTNSANRELDWWKISDFDESIGDIKSVWEPSRFDWVISCVQQQMTGNIDAYSRLERWLEDWCKVNHPYKGPNWKCGQEASIRVMHLALAALISRQIQSCHPGLIDLIKIHLRRIKPTLQYALAQNNNHGTSEAAAMFIGGSWVELFNIKQGRIYTKIGRKLLENRAMKLILPDGGFSQYSLNYHRMMLDTFIMVELWRKELNLPKFSNKFYSRLSLATEWLRSFVSEKTGDAPNLGANDGAHLLKLTDSPYRDYRPTVQLASILFKVEFAYSKNNPEISATLKWLRLKLPAKQSSKNVSQQFDSSGYVVLHRKNVLVLMRYPEFKFRPSQADALHVDFWLDGVNWLRDAGTYSYNTSKKWLNYFPSVAAHNTIQFDYRDQMPRISRFLFGDWLMTDRLLNLENNESFDKCGAGYTDKKGCKHYREILLEEKLLVVVDEIDGFNSSAILRWRLWPGDWILNGMTALCGSKKLIIYTNSEINRLEIVTGYESRYYSQITELPVLEIEVSKPGIITTHFSWTDE